MKKAIRLLALSLVLVMTVVLLASCGAPAKDPDDAKAALKENDYEALKFEGTLGLAIFSALGIENLDSVVSGTAKIDDKVEHVTIFYFEDKDAADAAWDKVQEYAEEENEDNEDWKIKKSGAMIYFGTAAGIKAAK